MENLPLYGKMELQQNLNRRVVERLEVYVRVRLKFIALDVVYFRFKFKRSYEATIFLRIEMP